MDASRSTNVNGVSSKHQPLITVSILIAVAVAACAPTPTSTST